VVTELGHHLRGRATSDDLAQLRLVGDPVHGFDHERDDTWAPRDL
jgi:hypothetical protein